MLILNITLYILGGFFLIAAMTSIIIFIILKNNKKMFKEIKEVLEKNYKGYENFSLEQFKGKSYDLILTFKNFKFFIKVVKNYGNSEICVNNKVKWQLRHSAFDESMRMVDGIEGLIMADIKEDSKKIIKKLFIVYPNSKNLLKYINECEMIFIYHNTDVYGSNIITFADLSDNPSILNVK